MGATETRQGLKIVRSYHQHRRMKDSTTMVLGGMMVTTVHSSDRTNPHSYATPMHLDWRAKRGLTNSIAPLKNSTEQAFTGDSERMFDSLTVRG